MKLECGRCVVRDWERADRPSLVRFANNRNVWLNLRDRMPHPYTLPNAEAYLQHATTADQEETFCIEVDGQVAGSIGLMEKEDVHRYTAELGYWLAEPFWGRGIATEAVREFVVERLRTTSLHRIFAEVFSSNPASVRVLEKAGFEFEGRLRKNVVKDGQILDSLVYARVRERL